MIPHTRLVSSMLRVCLRSATRAQLCWRSLQTLPLGAAVVPGSPLGCWSGASIKQRLAFQLDVRSRFRVQDDVLGLSRGLVVFGYARFLGDLRLERA